MNIDFRTKVAELVNIDLTPENWEPVNFYPYESFINGIWKDRKEWNEKNQKVADFYDFAKEYVIAKGYTVNFLGVNHKRNDWDNKVAVELKNKITNDVLFIGMKDWQICIGSTVDAYSAKACPIQK